MAETAAGGWVRRALRSSVSTQPSASLSGTAYVQNGRNCRAYTETIYIDGQPQTARGTACRNPDGTWTPLS